MANVFALIKQHQEELAARKTRFKAEKIPDGESQWRILPAKADLGVADPANKFWQDFGVHYVKQVNAEGQEEFDTYVCEDKTYQADCPVCQAIFSTLNDISTYDEVRKGRIAKPGFSQALVNALGDAKASARVLVNAIRIDGSGDKKVVMLELSIKTWEAVVAAAAKRNQIKGTNAFSSNAGLNFFFTREGKGRNTKYQVDLDVDVTSVTVDPEQMTDLEAFASRQRDEGREKVMQRLKAISGGRIAIAAAKLTGSLTSTPTTMVPEATHAMSVEIPAATSRVLEVDPDALAPADLASTISLDASDFHEVSTRAVPAQDADGGFDDDAILKELEGLS